MADFSIAPPPTSPDFPQPARSISRPSRKRRRSGEAATVERASSGHPPPPFAPAHAALVAAHRTPRAPRRLVGGASQPVVNLAVIAAHRLAARDFPGAAAVLPALLRRYRAFDRNSVAGPAVGRWVFTRETVVAGAEVLRRAGHPQDLEQFLSLVVRDRMCSRATANSPQSYAGTIREYALLELALEQIVSGRLREAYDALRQEAELPPFRASPLIHAYLGLLCLALATDEGSRGVPVAAAAAAGGGVRAAGAGTGVGRRHGDGGVGGAAATSGGAVAHLLSGASKALGRAAQLDPRAHCFAHYAAAAAVAAGDCARAVAVLRDFVARNPDDAAGMQGLLHALRMYHGGDARVREERVAVARRLVAADAASGAGLQVLREAHAWKWLVQPAVGLVEVADAVAGQLECGRAGAPGAWEEVYGYLRRANDVELSQFMFASGRESWWLSHFFRQSRAAVDAATSLEMAQYKKAIAMLLYGDHCAYVRASAAVALPVSTVEAGRAGSRGSGGGSGGDTHASDAGGRGMEGDECGGMDIDGAGGNTA